MNSRSNRCATCVLAGEDNNPGGPAHLTCKNVRLCDAFDVSMVKSMPGLTVAAYIERQRTIDLGQAIVRAVWMADGTVNRFDVPATIEGADWMIEVTQTLHRRVFHQAFGSEAGQHRQPGSRRVGVGHNAHALEGLEPHEITPALRQLWMHQAPVRMVKARNVESAARWAARFCQGFFRIHPFHDGNGRTARLIVELVAASNGIAVVWPTYRSRGENTEDRTDYLEALQHAHKHKGLTKAGEWLVPARNPYAPLTRWWAARLKVRVDEEAADAEGEGGWAGAPDSDIDVAAILATVEELRRGAALPPETLAIQLPYHAPPPKKVLRHAGTLSALRKKR